MMLPSGPLAFSTGAWAGTAAWHPDVAVLDAPVCRPARGHGRRWTMLGATSSVPNFRDVASADPGRIRPARIYRTACPVDATAADAESMSAIRTLIDLRSNVERKYETGEHSVFLDLFRAGPNAGPNPAPRRPDANRAWVTIPLLSRLIVAWQVFRRTTLKQKLRLVLLTLTLRLKSVMDVLRGSLDTGGLPLVNEIMLRCSKRQICSVFETMAAEDSQPVAIFCTAGKDRTGLMVALLLAVLGVSREKIVADYVRSEEMYKANPGQREKQMHLLTKAGLTPDRWMENPPSVIEHALGLVQTKYGGIDAFLESAGVTEATRTRLREKLLL